MKMNQAALALALGLVSLTAAAAEQAAPSVESEAPVKPGQTVSIKVDKGQLRIAVGRAPVAQYKVEFVPDRKPSWWERADAPDPKAVADCKAEYTAEGGLKVATGKGINAIVTVSLPDRQPLNAQLMAGILAIDARTGTLEAFIGKGILEYDSAGLPAGSCVRATINAGTVQNIRDFNCTQVGAVLHGHSGIIKVK